jgi:methenyltetrahydromethanopterin cyclohydrolase
MARSFALRVRKGGLGFMISLNARAAGIVGRMTGDAEALGSRVGRLPGGATVVDAGINARGSREAGRLLAEASMGGLGRAAFCHERYGGEEGELIFPSLSVDVALPHLACMASQYAGWPLRLGDYAAIASGPARALAGGEEIFDTLGYSDPADVAVLMLEGRTPPDEVVAAHVAGRCGVAPEKVTLIVAPTASIVGSVQVAARSVETALHKLHRLGFDVRRVAAASGFCPIAPVAADDVSAVGRTNDALLYGSRVFLSVHAPEEDIAALIGVVPAESSPDYGSPFLDLFLRHGGDFFGIDPMLFSPARIEIHCLESGRTLSAGRVAPDLLRRSLPGADQ